tara:strand:+ start:6917 stop:7840 length:924 start_codon:yes stop_codon:yes gene_type:complete
MKILFPFHDCVALRYFIPLAIESKKRGHVPVFNITEGFKYNGVSIPENRRQIDWLMRAYGISQGSEGDVCVTIEGCEARSNMINYTLTVLLDYISLYPKYINHVDYVVFPTEWFVNMVIDAAKKPISSWNANASMCIDAGIVGHPKNLYLGSPKYDVSLCREEICKKYDLNNELKYTLVMYPRPEDRQKFNLDLVCQNLISKGRIPILKSRKKHPFLKEDRKKYLCVYDKSWYPSTSLELMHIAEEVIGTDSTAVKESIMLEKEMINIPSKNYRILERFYDSNAKKKYLYFENSCKRILDHMEKNVK